MKQGIYAIFDTMAKDITGGLYLHKHQAAAVRFYADVATDKDTSIYRHPQDYDLILLGYIQEDLTLEPRYSVILKGSVWIAAQTEVLNEQPKLEITK